MKPGKRHRQQKPAATAGARSPDSQGALAGGAPCPWPDWLGPAVFLLSSFCYVWMSGVPAVRYYYSSPPHGPGGVSTLFDRPGGVAAFVAGFLDWRDAEVGPAALIALVEASLISAATLLLLRRVTAPHAGGLSLVPLAFWLVLQNFPDAQIHAVSLELLTALWGAWLVTNLRAGIVAGISVLSLVLFWLFGLNAALVFLLTMVALTACCRRWVLLLLAVFLAGVALFSFAPLTGRSLASHFHWSDAGLRVALTSALYLCLPLELLLQLMRRRGGGAAPESARNNLPASRRGVGIVLGAQAGVVLMACAGLWLTSNPREKAIIRVDQCARQGDWAGVLAAAREVVSPPAATRLDVHRALFHQSGLGETLFTVPQVKETALIPDLRAGSGAYLPISEFWLEVGLVNAAQHYASEALELRGPRPWILRQLARILLVKDQPLASRVFLICLKAFRSQRDWAERRLAAIETGSAPPDEDPGAIRRLGVTTDQVSKEWSTPDLLHQLLQANPTNRMAFEFLMAHYLVSFQLEHFVAELDHLKVFHSKRLPRYYQEALLLYMEDPRGPTVDLTQHSILPETVQRFGRFKAILRQHGLKSATLEQALLPEFGDSLWFYYLLGYTGAVSAATPRPS